MKEQELDRKSFRALIVAQFIGAFNDNCFKLFLIFFALGGDASWDAKIRLTIIATCLFFLPFVLFSPHAGRIADRFSKRDVTVGVKGAEIILMAASAIGFYLGSEPFLLAVLFLMAVQSAIFGPAKYGILPELLPAGALPRANGVLELSTFVAIISGTVASGLIYEVVEEQLFVGGILLTILAFAGFVAATAIRRVPAAVPDRPVPINPFPEVASCFRDRKSVV